MDALMLIVYRLLATYRLTYLVLYEDGPFELAAHVRTWGQTQPEWVRDGLHCSFCVSFWMALLIVWLPRRVVEGLGIAALVVIYKKLEGTYWRELRLL